MFKRLHRLTKKADFEKLFKEGASVGSKFFVIKYQQTNQEYPTKVAFIVSNKVEKSAVKRNKIKRRAREIVKHSFNEFSVGYDIAFIAKPAVKNAPFEEIEKDLLSLLKKAGMIHSV